MFHLQSIIDRIRIVLARERYEESPEIKELAGDFSDQTRQLNERLRRCGEYLRQGLRSEAIHEAETEPRLLDCVSVLESFSEEERNAWNDVCEFLDLSVGESLLRDVAIMVDEAYAEQAPLESLLRQHRKLALQRAPLSIRLRLLRTLAQADCNSEHWAEDLARFEEVRHEQIAQEARSQRKVMSADALDELLTEVNSKEWIVPPPPKIVSTIRTMRREAVRSAARQKLGEIERELHQAHADMDYQKGRIASEQWQKVVPIAELPANDPLITRSMAALAWCEQERGLQTVETAWQNHVHTVELALDRPGTDQQTLARLVEQASRMGRELPDPLGTRLMDRLRGLQGQRSRQRLLIGATASMGAIAIVAMVVMIIHWSNEVSQRHEITKRIHQMIERGEIEQVSELANQFNARWQHVPEWLDTKASIVTAQKSLADRERRYEALMSQVEAVSDTDEKGFERLIREAEVHVNMPPVSDDLKQRFDQRWQMLTAERQKRKNKLEESLASRVAVQETEITSLESKFLEMELAEFTATRDRILGALNVLADAPGLPKNLADSVQFFRSRLDDVDRKNSKAIRRKQLFAELSKHSRVPHNSPAPGVDGYIASLTKGAETLIKSDTLIEELQMSSQEAPAWKAIYAVQQGLPSDPTLMFPVDPQKLALRKKEIAGLIEQHKMCPLQDVLKTYSALLKTLEERQNAVETFRKYLSTEEMSGLFVVYTTTTPRPYYLNESAELKSGSFFRWCRRNESSQVRLSFSKLKNSKPEDAPQKQLAEKLRAILKEIAYDNWGDICRRLVETTLAERSPSASDVDPILKLEIVSRINDMAVKGHSDWNTQKPFQGFVEPLQAARIKYANADWADPEDKNLEKYRDTVSALERDAKLNSAKAFVTAAAPYTDLGKTLQDRYEAIGFMWKLDEQAPPIQIPLNPGKPYQILASVPLENATATAIRHRFEVVGDINSKGQIEPNQDSLSKYFRAGRLLFVKTSND
jgi:hypothetical protein